MSKKKEVGISVDSDFLKQLKKRVGATTDIDVVRAAFAILDWASAEAQSKRVVLSSTPQGEDIHRLIMSELESVRTAA